MLPAIVNDLVIRFLIGGAVVSAFAVLGNLFRPRSFAGLFGAAPSVALATLALTIAKHGTAYAATEGRSMMAGALALCVYCRVVSWVLMRYQWPALLVTSISTLVWLSVAFGTWSLLLR